MIRFKVFWEGYKRGFLLFGESITTTITALVLLFVYLVGVGLTSITAKIFGLHFLTIKRDKRRKTYWVNLNLDKKDMKKYLRQY